MAYETKPNSGSMFVNNKKTTDRHPDRNGNADIVCPKCSARSSFWVSGWVKSRDGAEPWLSLAFKPKDQSQTPQPRLPQPQEPNLPQGEQQEEVPF